jgi:UDP-N-acetylmuramoylalanine--D-glutamate ligase
MKIALLGYGIEGASAYRYLKKLHPHAEFEIYDNAISPKYEVPKGVVFRGGVSDFHNIDADIVMRTPAIPVKDVSTRGVVSSATQEFFEACPVPIVGITGTKGKGTTASLISDILRKAGIKTWLVGNIGTSSLDALDEISEQYEAGEKCVVVYELSSFQLWDLKRSPHVAIVLMIEPEHLNVHDDFDDYVSAKSNIVRYQTKDDVVIYYADNEISEAVAHLSEGEKLPYVIERGPYLRVGDEVVAERSDISLYGAHNVGNVQAAILAAWQFTQDKDAIREAVREFKGLPHRLEKVAVKSGVTYINDSFSSAPPATVAAAKAFRQPKIMIMGGYDRGLDFEGTVREIVGQPNMKKVLLIGQTKERIAAAFKGCRWYDYELAEGDMQKVVERARELADPGDVVILSPGCASFDMFKDFTQRGDKFKESVAKL